MLNFYYTPGTCARASHIALVAADARFTATRVDFASSQQRSPEYLRINPKGRVPALVTDRGILTETPAILQYIAQTHPQAGLAPLDDAFALAQMNAFNSYLCSTVHVAHAHKGRGARWADEPEAHEAMRRRVAKNMTECFALIEGEYFRGPWVLGAQFSTCDAYLFTIGQWLEGDGVDPAQFTQVFAHRQRMLDLPAVQQVLAVETAPLAPAAA